jgi:hypothetical protein
MASQSALIDTTSASKAQTGVVTCDHAVFSSVRTVVGKGYQIVAASKGLSHAEKKDITTRSPSHGGLCEDGPEATAVAFYKLSSGRLALAFSCDAGAEHTGRGVRRIYTHITVINAEDFARFRFNVSNVLLAVDETGWLDVELQPPHTLEPLELRVRDQGTGKRVAAAVERHGTGWITAVLSSVLQGNRVVAGGDFDPGDWVEAVLAGVPGPRRQDISFSAGLRFTVGRTYSVSAVTGDLRQTRRLVKGQSLQYVEPGQSDAPSRPDSPWLQMIERCFATGKVDLVLSLTASDFPDASDSAMDRIGTMCNVAERSSTAEGRELLQLATTYVDSESPNAFEADLKMKLLRTVQSHLCERLRGEPEFEQHWPALSNLLYRSPTAAEFAFPAVAVVLNRLAYNAPISAAAYLMEAVEALGDSEWTKRLHAVLGPILEGFRAWLPVAETDELDRARTILNEWRRKLPEPDAVTGILDQIEERLASAD